MQVKNNGYTKAPNAIIRDPGLSPTAKVAWMLISSMKPTYHPTREQWMEMLPCKDKGTWNRAVRELVDAGLVEVETVMTAKHYRVVTQEQEGGKSTPSRVENPPSQGLIIRPPMIITEEQEKNNSEVRARLREEVMNDAMVEMGCMSTGISRDTYTRLTAEIFNDWEFTGIPDDQWNKMHFLSVLRIKAREAKRYGQNNNNRGTAAESREQRAANVAAKMAALGAAKEGTPEYPF